ncbi:MAG TPA: YihY/virulence factor BrkB family protein [Acidimicrobiales bacterium]|nr:YihY/virulence factor BrkB family protein [Acidimicrobiales bacterium]
MSEKAVPTQTGAPDQLQSPADLTGSDWKATLQRTVKEFKADRATLISAGMAFYWFLAIFPALVAAVGIFGLVNAGTEAKGTFQEAIRTTLPGGAADVLAEALGNAPSGGASLVTAVVGLALALFSASAGMVALQNGLDVAYDVPQERERKYLKKRLRGLLLIVVAGILGGVATVFTVFGRPLGETFSDSLPFGGGVFVAVWTVVRWLLAIGAIAVLFAAFYYLGPSRESPRWSWLSPGGVVGAVIWLLSSLGFSLYVSSVGSYTKNYGSFAGVVVLLLWLYLSAIAVMLGAELNAETERQSAIRGGGAPEQAGEGRATGSVAAAPPERPAAGRPDDRPPDEQPAVPSEWTKRMEEIRSRR